mgnify:CR=1 FL=1
MFETLSQLTGSQLALFVAVLTLPILPNLWGIWHCFHRDFPTVNEKMIWLGVTVFIPVIGGLAYLIAGRKRGRKPL